MSLQLGRSRVWSRYFGLFFSVAILLSQAISVISQPDVIDGQVGKQTFALEMARSFSEGRVTGVLFPERQFIELHHEAVIPWAEEFPIYSGFAGFFGKITGDLQRSARVLSILGWFLFLFATWSWLSVEGSVQAGLSLFSKNIWMVLVGSVSVVQVYGRSVMPDGWMLALCFFSILLWEEEKFKKSRAVILLACLAKYYAVFTAVALSWVEFRRRKFVSAFLYCLACLPAVLYIGYFLSQKIPNPILEYRNQDGHGHMTAATFILDPHFYLRFLTWVFVKLTSPLGGILAVFGVVLARGKNIALPVWLTPLFLAQCGFAVMFAPSFFVHDYYALSFLPVFMGAWMLLLKVLEGRRYFRECAVLVATVFVVWNGIRANAMTERATSFLQAEAQIRECLPNWNQEDYSVFLVDRSAPVLPHRLRMRAWIAGLPQLADPGGERLLNLRANDPRTQAVVIWIREPFFPAWRPAQGFKLVCDLKTHGDQAMGEDSRLLVLRR